MLKIGTNRVNKGHIMGGIHKNSKRYRNIDNIITKLVAVCDLFVFKLFVKVSRKYFFLES
jgi:hypothetical protein